MLLHQSDQTKRIVEVRMVKEGARTKRWRANSWLLLTVPTPKLFTVCSPRFRDGCRLKKVECGKERMYNDLI